MTAFENRVIKSKLIDILERQGYKASATDSSSIVVFTDKSVNEKSKRLPKSESLTQPYITSFGAKSALKYIETHKGTD